MQSLIHWLLRAAQQNSVTLDGGDTARKQEILPRTGQLACLHLVKHQMSKTITDNLADHYTRGMIQQSINAAPGGFGIAGRVAGAGDEPLANDSKLANPPDSNNTNNNINKMPLLQGWATD